jgi:hypothetical protein
MMIVFILNGIDMITAKKAKEQIIKSISKKKYIQKVEALIHAAINEYQFRCDVTIDEYDDIDVDMITTSRCVVNWLEHYGYRATIVSRDSKRCTIEISWNV